MITLDMGALALKHGDVSAVWRPLSGDDCMMGRKQPTKQPTQVDVRDEGRVQSLQGSFARHLSRSSDVKAAFAHKMKEASDAVIDSIHAFVVKNVVTHDD
jgi:hypothetical protein